MPCSDSSSSIAITISHDERFIAFDFAKITCGREITAETGYKKYCVGRELQEIIQLPFTQALTDLDLKDEEGQYVLYLEWDALRSALAQYLGIHDDQIDANRCLITSIEHTEQTIEIAEVIFPPKEMPKITACGIIDKD